MIDTADKSFFYITLALLIVCVSLFGVSAYYFNDAHNMHQQLKVYFDGLERLEMTNTNDTIGRYKQTLTNGIWYGTGYYCVWTKGRDVETIIDTDPSFGLLKSVYVTGDTVNKTAFHELMHEMVNRNKEHFCGDLI